MHLTPAGLPAAIPGKGEEIDNATQQAPQFSLQFIRQIYKEVTLVTLGTPGFSLYFCKK